MRRSYSICSSQQQFAQSHEIEVGVKPVAGGTVTAKVVLFTPKIVANYVYSTKARGQFDPLNAEISVNCPQCGSANTTLTSHFGSTACKALYKCLDCMEPFDYFKPY